MAYPSTFADIYNDVIATSRLDATNDLSRVKDWINQLYTEVCAETEAIQSYATMTLTSGQSVYTIDATISRIKAMYCTPAGGTQLAPLQPVSIEQILLWNTATGGATAVNTGGATHYAIFGLNDIQFYPQPTAADVVTIYYVKLPTVLSAASDVPGIPEPYASNCLKSGGLYRASLYLKDPDATLYAQDFERSKQALRGHLRRKEGAGTKQFRVLSDRPWVYPHDPSTDIRQLR